MILSQSYDSELPQNTKTFQQGYFLVYFLNQQMLEIRIL